MINIHYFMMLKKNENYMKKYGVNEVKSFSTQNPALKCWLWISLLACGGGGALGIIDNFNIHTNFLFLKIVEQAFSSVVGSYLKTVSVGRVSARTGRDEWMFLCRPQGRLCKCRLLINSLWQMASDDQFRPPSFHCYTSDVAITTTGRGRV